MTGNLPEGGVCRTFETSAVKRGKTGAEFTQADLSAYCAWESECWPANDEVRSGLCTATAAALSESSEQCLEMRDACLAAPASAQRDTCSSAKLEDVQATCGDIAVEELERCSREFLQSLADVVAGASCDKLGEQSDGSSVSEACKALFTSCAIWGTPQ